MHRSLCSTVVLLAVVMATAAVAQPGTAPRTTDLLRPEDLDTGRSSGAIERQPDGSLAGFVRLHAVQTRHVPRPDTTALVTMARALRHYTDIDATVGQSLWIGSAKLRRCRFVLVSGDYARYEPDELAALGTYLSGGGLAVITDKGTTGAAGKDACQELLHRALGRRVRVRSLDVAHPVYSAVFDLRQDYFTGTGHPKGLPATAYYDGERLVALFFRHAITAARPDVGTEEASLQFGVNLAVYAVTR